MDVINNGIGTFTENVIIFPNGVSKIQSRDKPWVHKNKIRKQSHGTAKNILNTFDHWTTYRHQQW